MLLFQWIKNAHQSLKISTKIFIITFVLVESIIIALGFSYYRHSSSVLIKAQTDYAHQVISKSDEYLELNLETIRSFFLSVAHDSRFQNQAYDEISKWLDENLIYFIPSAQNIHLIEDDELLVSTSPHGWLIMENSKFQEELDQVTKVNELYWFPPYFSNVSYYTVTVAMKIPSTQGENKILALDLDLSGLYDSLFPNKSSSLQGELLLLDRNDQPVFGRAPYTVFDVFDRKYELKGMDPTILREEWEQRRWNNNEHNRLFLTRSQNNLMGWQVIWVMDETELLLPLRQTLHYTWLLAVLSLLLSVGIAYTLSFLLSRPIRQIIASVDEVSSGNLNSSIPINRKDELGMLANHINRMTRKIRELIEHLRETEAKKKESDFKALQLQIRPHFLYNTLNTTSAFARQGQLEKVDQMIALLTEQLQYSLDSNPEPVTLREELVALESYIQLMMTRYMNKFTFQLEIDPPALGYKLPKFTLQPLIENSIFHGLVPKEGVGVLFIGAVAEEEYWEIIIEDDGIGMAEEQRCKLLHMIDNKQAPFPESSTHIGLQNVHYRLRLMYGDNYHIRLSSRHNFGTRIMIRLPKHSN
jgi:two-component system sensor histidine kinase YesM